MDKLFIRWSIVWGAWIVEPEGSVWFAIKDAKNRIKYLKTF